MNLISKLSYLFDMLIDGFVSFIQVEIYLLTPEYVEKYHKQTTDFQLLINTNTA